MLFDNRIITEFLEDFARNVIITDDEYKSLGLHHLMNFRNRIGQHEYDKTHNDLQKHFRQQMLNKQIFILEDEDLIINENGSRSKTYLPNMKQFRSEIPYYIVSNICIYLILLIFKIVIYVIIA